MRTINTPACRLATVAAVALLALVPGCGGGPGTVKGTVAYKGKPLVCGTIGFVATDGVVTSANVNPDGSYTVDVPRGAYKVVVVSPKPEPEGTRGGGFGNRRSNSDPAVDLPKPDPKLWVPIPPAVADPATSNLATTVGGGENTYNVDIP